MNVRALIEFRDIKAKKIREVGTVFAATLERVEELNSTRYGKLVELVDEVEKPPKKS